MQVRLAAREGDVDAVAAAEQCLRVQRLVDVADEVDYEFRGDGALGRREVGVEEARSLRGVSARSEPCLARSAEFGEGGERESRHT